jgi:hypothetical protein
VIQEYYLHLFCGVNGEHDQSTGAGRLAIAALMAGYGLNATTKKDLQSRVEWEVTPGCFLGQKEVNPTDYYCRNYPETKFAACLVPFRKVNRTMNYQLDWAVIDGEWDWKITSPVWLNLAKIYWLGYFLFGRNVLPDTVIESLRTKFRPQCENSDDRRRNLHCAYFMQFLKNIGISCEGVQHRHLFSDSLDDLPREQVFGSLVVGMNWAENVTGFYAMAAMMGDLVPTGVVLRNMDQYFGRYVSGFSGRAAHNAFPILQPHYYQLGLATPSIPSSPSRMPSSGREVIPLLWCNNQRTPAEEAAVNYHQVRGTTLNTEYFSANRQVWMTGAVMWEYYMLLTGRPLFPLEVLTRAREGQGWTRESILEVLMYLSPCNMKNSSVAQIVRFNLDRQSQV